ncbi:MAG: 4-hydroxy-tetrahydrodipicolinate synthase, partial [Deltaproteobacteria bacterium]|nr:4-hydroxy-tetrahydrodipicolinate synthase [Deltaproteobacteria bacterium]
MTILFQGSMTALITPFRDGKVDEEILRHLVSWQIGNKTDVLVPCGTTGEAPTLEPEEQEKIIRIVVEEAKKRVPVLAGAGSHCTKKAIHLTELAKQAGANGVLQVTPYYNKPTQAGLFQHFRTIAQNTTLPIVLYNVPGRTAVNMTAETTIRLSKISNIVGIKEASGDLKQVQAIIEGTDEDFSLFSGDDPLNAEIYALGGKGAISVTSNVAPDRVADVWRFFQQGKKEAGLAAHEKLQILNKILFLETN